MTMQQMNEYLEKRGFEVERTYMKQLGIYRFMVKRDGHITCANFKYPTNTDWNDRNERMQEFLDTIVRLHEESRYYHCEWPKENPNVYISTARGCGKSQLELYKEMFENMYGSRKAISKPYVDPMGIKDVIFNDPATIVFWTDGTKTVVKCQEGDEFDPEKGLTMAIVKKVYGNKGSYCNVIKKWCEPYYEKQKEKNDLVARICDLGKKATAALAALNMAETAIVNAKEREEKKYRYFYKYDDPIFDTREEAEKCIQSLKDIVEKYGCASVADLYDVAGLGTSYLNSKYGWINIDGCTIRRYKNGYVIDLPRAIPIE